MLEDYKEISNVISTLNKFDLNELICEGLINILTPIMNGFSHCLHQCVYFKEKNRIIMTKIYNLIGLVYMILSFLISDIVYIFGCENPYYPDYSPIIIFKK